MCVVVCANRPPAKPAITPPMPKADTLAAVRSMPALCAATSSSPTARHSVPMRERSSHHSNSITAATKAQINANTDHALQPLAGK